MKNNFHITFNRGFQILHKKNNRMLDFSRELRKRFTKEEGGSVFCGSVQLCNVSVDVKEIIKFIKEFYKDFTPLNLIL